MLVIRLQRRGKKNQPFYRIVVTDKRNAPKAGVSVEEIGYVNPLTKERSVNKERAMYWVSVGAQPSDTVHNLLVSEGIIAKPKKKISVKPCKNPEKRKSTKAKKETPTKEEPKTTEKPVEEKKEDKKPEKEETKKTA